MSYDESIIGYHKLNIGLNSNIFICFFTFSHLSVNVWIAFYNFMGFQFNVYTDFPMLINTLLAMERN